MGKRERRWVYGVVSIHAGRNDHQRAKEKEGDEWTA
jgi:hypothetical protein